MRENQTQGDEASAEGHGQSDTPAAAARMAMVCRATRRAASNELPAARRAPAARVGLHQTLATSRETVHTIQMLWHERTPVPTTDPRGVKTPALPCPRPPQFPRYRATRCRAPRTSSCPEEHCIKARRSPAASHLFQTACRQTHQGEVIPSLSLEVVQRASNLVIQGLRLTH